MREGRPISNYWAATEESKGEKDTVAVVECPRDMNPRLHEIIKLFFPDLRVVYGKDEGLVRVVFALESETKDGYRTRVEVKLGKESRVAVAEGGDKKAINEEARKLLYLMLVQLTGRRPSPYGTLTGVRPTKIVHHLLDLGLAPPDIEKELAARFLVEKNKLELLLKVAQNNRPFLEELRKQGSWVSVYIGIPYCPSRCHYCSFPGYPLSYRPGVTEFFSALKKEINRVGGVLKDTDLKVRTVYVGGGTPTVLDLWQWEELLDDLHRLFLGEETREFTVEAGRPDTLKIEVLTLLVEGGVTRLCINPQSMNDSTLQVLGRKHTVREVYEAFGMARSAGVRNINMDLIAGLPGEDVDLFERSLQQILALEPEGVTIHTLAIKRGSKWHETRKGTADDQQADIGARQVRLAHTMLEENGFLPYYMYRQKYMVGNLENVGYAKPGFFGLYNIYVTEEAQSIIGLGCGATSKYLKAGSLDLRRFYSPKDPAVYIQRLEALIAGQVDNIQGLT